MSTNRSQHEDLPELFAQWLFLRGRKPTTVALHKRNLANLLKARCIPFSQQNLQEYVNSFRIRGSSSSHINNQINCIRLLIQYMNEKGVKHDCVLSEWKFVKDRYRMKATMSDEEITAFLDLPRPITKAITRWGTTRSWSNVSVEQYHKWTVFFSIMAYSGMRPGEVASLDKTRNVDFGRDVFVLEDTKTNEPRYVPIAPNIKELLLNYISTLETNKLFPSSRPSGVTSNVEWHYNFHTRIKRLGIVRPNLTPYSLRHSLITRLLEEDVNIFKVQKIVGHHDLRTTAHYTHITTKDIQAAIAKHPIIMKGTDPENILNSLEEFMNNLDLRKDERFKYRLEREKGKLVINVEIRSASTNEELLTKPKS